MTTPTDAILGPVLAADPGSPLVTHYDVAFGSRIELSAASTANWSRTSSQRPASTAA